MFKRNVSPATPVVERITVQDAVVASSWELTDWQWATLTDADRADYRERVVYAPKFNV